MAQSYTAARPAWAPQCLLCSLTLGFLPSHYCLLGAAELSRVSLGGLDSVLHTPFQYLFETHAPQDMVWRSASSLPEVQVLMLGLEVMGDGLSWQNEVAES